MENQTRSHYDVFALEVPIRRPIMFCNEDFSGLWDTNIALGVSRNGKIRTHVDWSHRDGYRSLTMVGSKWLPDISKETVNVLKLMTF